MIFLIHYSRSGSELISIREFIDRAEASAAKLDIEISLLNSPNGHEVVLLEADDKQSLKKSHSRYFSSLRDLKMSD